MSISVLPHSHHFLASSFRAAYILGRRGHISSKRAVGRVEVVARGNARAVGRASLRLALHGEGPGRQVADAISYSFDVEADEAIRVSVNKVQTYLASCTDEEGQALISLLIHNAALGAKDVERVRLNGGSELAAASTQLLEAVQPNGLRIMPLLDVVENTLAEIDGDEMLTSSISSLATVFASSTNVREKLMFLAERAVMHGRNKQHNTFQMAQLAKAFGGEGKCTGEPQTLSFIEKCSLRATEGLGEVRLYELPSILCQFARAGQADINGIANASWYITLLEAVVGEVQKRPLHSLSLAVKLAERCSAVGLASAHPLVKVLKRKVGKIHLAEEPLGAKRLAKIALIFSLSNSADQNTIDEIARIALRRARQERSALTLAEAVIQLSNAGTREQEVIDEMANIVAEKAGQYKKKDNREIKRIVRKLIAAGLSEKTFESVNRLLHVGMEQIKGRYPWDSEIQIEAWRFQRTLPKASIIGAIDSSWITLEQIDDHVKYLNKKRPLALDLGCGMGNFILSCMEAPDTVLPSCNFLGVDISTSSCRRARGFLSRVPFIKPTSTSTSLLHNERVAFVNTTVEETLDWAERYDGKLQYIFLNFPTPPQSKSNPGKGRRELHGRGDFMLTHSAAAKVGELLRASRGKLFVQSNTLDCMKYVVSSLFENNISSIEVMEESPFLPCMPETECVSEREGRCVYRRLISF